MEDLRSYIKTFLQKMGFHVNGDRHDETVVQKKEPVQAERRREIRRPRISPCTYGVMRSVDRDGSVIEEGYGTAVNDSLTGMRLLLAVAPSKGQLLEIQTEDRTLERPISLVEVCWTKPLRENAQEDAQEELYLVGCRQTFGGNHDETHVAATRIPRGIDL
jgi:hypothetical protein